MAPVRLKDTGSRPDSTPVDLRERIKILGVTLLVAALLATAWTVAGRAMATDEERILRQLEELSEAFDDASLRRVMRFFHPEFLDEETRIDRKEVEDSARYLFVQSIGRNGTSYRVKIPEQETVIQLNPTDETATVDLRAIFERSGRGGFELWWDARARTTWVRQRGKWVMISSSEVNHRDRRR